MTVPQRPGPQITDEDVQAAVEAARVAGPRAIDRVDDDGRVSAPVEPVFAAVLASALRPGGLVARAVADELDRLAARYPGDVFLDDGTSRDAISGTALRTVLTAQARLWREGKK